MIEELKPCPFCGGEADVNCFPTDYPTEHCCAYIKCTKCGAEISREGRIEDASRLIKQVIAAWNRRAQQPNEPLTEENGKKFALQVIAKGAFIDHVEQSNFIVETTVIRLSPAALNGWILSDMTNTRECYEDGSEGDRQWEAHKVEYAERRKSWEAQVVSALGIDIDSNSDSISITQAQSDRKSVV